jgi:hypothetical protein
MRSGGRSEKKPQQCCSNRWEQDMQDAMFRLHWSILNSTALSRQVPATAIVVQFETWMTTPTAACSHFDFLHTPV